MGELPEWMSGKGSKRKINQRSQRQEKKRAEEIKGRVQPGSGSSRRAPQDVRAEGFLEQLKFTDAASYRLTAQECMGLLEDALRNGREPRLVIDFSQHGLRVVARIERLR